MCGVLGSGVKKSFVFVSADLGFVSEVSGRSLLAWRLSPLHVADGASPQDAEIQLSDRSTGLCWCPSREDSSGVSHSSSAMVYLASVLQQQWKCVTNCRSIGKTQLLSQKGLK